ALTAQLATRAWPNLRRRASAVLWTRAGQLPVGTSDGSVLWQTDPRNPAPGARARGPDRLASSERPPGGRRSIYLPLSFRYAFTFLTIGPAARTAPASC